MSRSRRSMIAEPGQRADSPSQRFRPTDHRLNGAAGHGKAKPDAGQAPDASSPTLPALPWWSSSLRHVLGRALATVARRRFDVQVNGLEHFHNRPATLMISNHTNDWDAIVLTAAFYRVFRARGPCRRIGFAAGEHMFERGYLGGYVLSRPMWLRRLIYPLGLGSVLQGLGIYPIPPLRRRKLGVHLRNLHAQAGDPPLGEIFDEHQAPRLPGAGPSTRLSQVLRWRYHQQLEAYHDFSIFKPKLARRLRCAHLQRVSACLERLAGVLVAGDCLFISPEDGLSTPGWSGQIKAGISRVAAMAGREVTVLPVNIAYDWRAGRRPGAVVSCGPELRGVEQWSRTDLEARVTSDILSMAPRPDPTTST